MLLLALLALASLLTSFRNPLNGFRPLARPTSSIVETRKAISMQRIETIGDAIDKYNMMNNKLPDRLQDLVPFYVSGSLLEDPWGNPYKYLKRPEKYLVIGFDPDGKADTDLFLSRANDSGPPTPSTTKPVTGGITLLD